MKRNKKKKIKNRIQCNGNLLYVAFIAALAFAFVSGYSIAANDTNTINFTVINNVTTQKIQIINQSQNCVHEKYYTTYEPELNIDFKPRLNIVDPLHYDISNLDNCVFPYNPNYFQRLADKVAGSHEYKLHEYDCTEFSEDLVRNLKAEGWKKSSVIMIKVDCESGVINKEQCYATKGKHDIVEINQPLYIEATSGNIIQPKDYEAYGID
ncbi:hypothetical protein ACFL43_01890 [Thermodesulfobacteriota bacterium]